MCVQDRDVFNEASLLKNHCASLSLTVEESNFNPNMNPQGAPRLVGNHNEPNDLEQENEAPNGHMQLTYSC